MRVIEEEEEEEEEEDQGGGNMQMGFVSLSGFAHFVFPPSEHSHCILSPCELIQTIHPGGKGVV